MKSQGFDSRTQGVAFSFAWVTFAMFILLGIQALFYPKARTTVNNTVMIASAAATLLLALMYVALKRRTRSANRTSR